MLEGSSSSSAIYALHGRNIHRFTPYRFGEVASLNLMALYNNICYNSD